MAAVLGLGALALHQASPAADEPTYEPVPGTTSLDLPELAEALPGAGQGRCGALPGKWMVVGWDGADWQFILPLLEAGRMPHLAGLLSRGAYGELLTIQPTLSPAVWTTVATGVSPGQHGIVGFYNQLPPLRRWLYRLRHFGHLDRHLFSNADRRARAAWNVLPDYGKRVMVVGYHNTFPVEPVEGLMVSNYLVQDHIGKVIEADGVEGSPFANSLVYPSRYLRTVLSIEKEVERELPRVIPRLVGLDPGQVQGYLARARTLDLEGDPRPYFATRAWAYDAIYARTARRLYPEIAPDVLFLHQQGVDWAAHYFLYFEAPRLFAELDTGDAAWRELDRERPLYQGTLDAFYEVLDRRLGRLLAERDPSTGVMILSDHGFEPEPDPSRTGFHEDAPPGILLLEGPGIQPGQRLRGATVYDVLPTLMASLGLPVSRRLEGRVLDEAFCGEQRVVLEEPVEVVSYGEGPYLPEVARPRELESDLMKQLRSLGYVQ